MQLALQTPQTRFTLKTLTAKFQLSQQLSSYGLNPDEWRFSSFRFDENTKFGRAQMVHRQDENLMLSGRIVQDQLSLRSLIKFRWDSLTWDL